MNALHRRGCFRLIPLVIPGLAVLLAECALCAPPATPEIAYITESVDDGSSFAIVGERLDPGVEVWLWQPGADTRETILRTALSTVAALPSVPPAEAKATAVLGRPSGRILIASQLGPFPALGDSVRPTVAWVKNAAGYSRPYFFNRPKLMFASDAEVLPGQRLRLFGRNLAPPSCAAGGTYDYPVAFQAASGTIHWGKVLDFTDQDRMDVKPYQLMVQVPLDLLAGEYSVRVHLLCGGPSAWSNGLHVRAIASRYWIAALAHLDDHPLATPRQLTARPPQVLRLSGAAGDGYRDDGEIIQTAIDRLAGAGGGVVLLPAGSYALTKTLHVPAGRRASRDRACRNTVGGGSTRSAAGGIPLSSKPAVRGSRGGGSPQPDPRARRDYGVAR